MEEVVTTGVITRAKLQSYRGHKQTNTASYRLDAFLLPASSVKALKRNLSFKN